MNRRIHPQRGAALLVVLLLLLVVTVLGLSSLRSTVMEERMSANMFDRSLGFQAAESALREVEAAVAQAATRASFPASGCSNGLCAVPESNALERWLDPGFTAWQPSGVQVAPAALGRPVFIAESLGAGSNWPGCERIEPRDPLCESPRFRITARSGAPGNDRALVILQSYVSTP